ncbi:MAG: cupin domain-containing protein [Myxococcus sp.]|nr:cupin domain-containing protein [Myxococcus sp.]
MAAPADTLGLLAEYALGTLSPEERLEVEAALAKEPALRAALAELEASMAMVTVSQGAPAHVWQQLEAAVSGGRRFSHLVPALALHFDISEPRARALAEALDDRSAWQPGPAPGLLLMPVEAGPKWAGFMSVVVRLEPGAQLPMHTHAAREQVLVLEGGYRDDQTGREFWRGEVEVREAGTSHSFTAVPGVACLCASVVKLAEDA